MSQPAKDLCPALQYSARGWKVFPLLPGSKAPATPHGYHDATCDELILRRWWRQEPRYGVGVSCADSGLLVLDIDPRNGGNAFLEALEAKHGKLPPTVEAATGGGGRHLVFQAPEGMTRSVGQLGPGVDVKFNGYIVVAPSIHPNGTRYAWTTPPGDPAYLQPAWEALVTPAANPTRPFGWGIRAERPIGSSRYGLRALDHECEAVRRAPEGSRNNTLNAAAFAVGQLEAGGEIDPADSAPALLEAASCCHMPEREARRTIESGLRAGRLSPRSAPPREERAAPPQDQVGDPGPGDVQAAAAEPEPDWTAGLVYRTLADGSRLLEATPGNLALLVPHSAGWDGTLGLNELHQAPYWIGTPPELEGFAQPRGRFADEHCVYIRQWLRRYHRVDWSAQATWDGVMAAAAINRFHPVQRYLESLEWDGIQRVGAWIETYFPGTPIPAMPVGGWWLISAVARAMRPGSQVDHMLVLEGPQGAGKSTAAAILGGEWFGAELGDVRDKDAAQSLAGVWIMEIAELDALKRADLTRIKTFLSQRSDHFRPSYGRAVVDRPRQCVFLGTTNESKYLHDASGGRRFWPVAVKPLDADRLYQDRDQIWAEALHLYRTGERWWPSGERECVALSQIAEERFAQDPWEEKLEDLMSSTTEEWTTGKLLAGVLGVPVERQDRAASSRVGSILNRLGFVSQRKVIAGKKVTVYRRKED